ncbi:hypothetical protein ACOME3_008709 [Neoechinorhynchus agilis]
MDSRKRIFSPMLEYPPPPPPQQQQPPPLPDMENCQFRCWPRFDDRGLASNKKEYSLQNKRKTTDMYYIEEDPLCFKCSKSIDDEYIYNTAPGIKLHRSCLKCEECGELLDEDCTCFVQSSKIYCKSDYAKLFSGNCIKCKTSFTSDDSVMRINSRAFHCECFKCDLCFTAICNGDEYMWTGEKLFCKKDWPSMENQPKQLSIKSESKSTVESETKTDNDLGQAVNLAKKPKTTRVRTVLNEKQLQTLRTCYNNNPRPDALMKEQLCEMTGLTPRVIRVWFQNKRCKDKKRSLMIKQLQEQERLREMSRSAVPMIAASPISNELANGHIGPVDISSYHHHHHHHWRPLAPNGYNPASNAQRIIPSQDVNAAAISQSAHQQQYDPNQYYPQNVTSLRTQEHCQILQPSNSMQNSDSSVYGMYTTNNGNCGFEDPNNNPQIR